MEEESSSWEFLAYPKITDGSQWAQMENRVKKGKWMVTEKVHGSNFCLSSNGSAVRCAKRNAWLPMDGDEDYYDCGDVVKKYAPLVTALHGQIKAKLGNAAAGGVVWVYGELFGGYYPGAGGSEDAAIQREILYCAHVDWIVFDVAWSATGNGKDAVFLQYSCMYDQCKAVGLPCSAPLFSGSMTECMHYKPHFASTIPGRFGLPITTSNVAEGVVIRCDVARDRNNNGLSFEILLQDSKGKAVRPIAKVSQPRPFVRILLVSASSTHRANVKLFQKLSRLQRVQHPRHNWRLTQRRRDGTMSFQSLESDMM